jgi:hypothetical protein
MMIEQAVSLSRESSLSSGGARGGGEGSEASGLSAADTFLGSAAASMMGGTHWYAQITDNVNMAAGSHQRSLGMMLGDTAGAGGVAHATQALAQSAAAARGSNIDPAVA